MSSKTLDSVTPCEGRCVLLSSHQLHKLGIPEQPVEEIACSLRDRSVSPVTLLSVTLVCEAGFDLHLLMLLFDEQVAKILAWEQITLIQADVGHVSVQTRGLHKVPQTRGLQQLRLIVSWS